MEDDYCLRFKGYSESMAVAAKSFTAMAEVPGQDPADGGELILTRPAAEISDFMAGINTDLANQAIRELTIYDKQGNVVDYDWDKIEELMLQEPDLIPPAVYAALIQMFDTMTMDSQATFIRRSYILAGDLPYDELNEKWVEQIWEISPVFARMAALNMCLLYASDLSMLYDENDDIHRRIFNAMLLMQTVALGEIRTYELFSMFDRDNATRPVIEFEEIDVYPDDEEYRRNEWDYKVTIKGNLPGKDICFRLLQYREKMDPLINS